MHNLSSYDLVMDEVPTPSELSLVELASIIERDEITSADDVAVIRDADELARRSRERLHELVATARKRGTSWQSIGDALGVSRQAAFKRFNVQNEGEPMSAQIVNLLDSTSEVFRMLDAGDYESVKARMTYACARALSKRKLMGVWDEVVRESGRLEGCADTSAQTPDGSTALSKFTNRHLNTGAIVQTTLQHEAGEWIGRVAYNGSGKITGILIAPPGTENLPF